MAANGIASSSDFQSSTLSQEQKLSPFSKITHFSGMLLGKLLSDTTFANPFAFSLGSPRPTSPLRPPSKRREFSEVAGLKIAMSITHDNEPKKSMEGKGNLVMRSSMKFNTPNSTPNLRGGSVQTNSSSVIFSIGDDDDGNTMELDPCGDEDKDYTEISISPSMYRKSSTAVLGVGDDDDDPVEADHIRSAKSRSIRHSLPVPIISPFSHSAETRTFIYGSGSSPRENMSMVTCSPIKGKVKVPEGQLIKQHSVLPVLIDTGHGFVAYDPTREMEKFEEYTCITTHGPNPKKTHIFFDYIFEPHTSESAKIDLEKELNKYKKKKDNGVDFVYPSSRFLTYCYGCGKKLDHGEDIYMYRSDRAFCSEECREQEIMFDEKMMKKKKAKAASSSRGPPGSS
ncbi:hypothetical protein Ancab_012119 [Ancistrocladus abbreviatus]